MFLIYKSTFEVSLDSSQTIYLNSHLIHFFNMVSYGEELCSGKPSFMSLKLTWYILIHFLIQVELLSITTVVQNRASLQYVNNMDATERNQLKMKRRTAAREQQVKAACFDVQLLSTTKDSDDYEMLGWKNSQLQKQIFNTDSCLLNQEFGPSRSERVLQKYKEFDLVYRSFEHSKYILCMQKDAQRRRGITSSLKINTHLNICTRVCKVVIVY